MFTCPVTSVPAARGFFDDVPEAACVVLFDTEDGNLETGAFAGDGEEGAGGRRDGRRSC